ncbi:MAG: porin family protein [Steroidobacteraceae bacterium]|nr:porin family protein [Steroidobacteraceae bacterium]
MRMKFRCSVLCASALSLPALAQEKPPVWELGMQLVYQDEQTIALEGGFTVSTHEAFGTLISVIYRFNERFEWQLALNWNDADYDAVRQSATEPTIRSIRGEITALTPRVSATYNFINRKITPYVTGGVGWSFLRTDTPSAEGASCIPDPWRGGACTQRSGDLDAFTYQLGVGMRWDLASQYTIRVSYEKQWIDFDSALHTPDFDQLRVGFGVRY